jgi:methylenetetrahydrofolate reductase (NADPH)
MYAIAKGMGCAGVHIGGHGTTYSQVEQIIETGEELAPNWRDLVAEFDYPQENGFYYFERDPESGLNRDKPSPRRQKPQRSPVGSAARLAHAVLFEPKSPVFKVLRPVARLVDRSPWMSRALLYFEHLAKVALFGCQNCGDCALFDVGYLCPVSQCPKNQRNGPCGGSYQGWCEVYPGEKQCIWVRAYLRLKARHEEDSIRENLVPPCNWELWETSSWLNFYMGRDHMAARLGVMPPGKQEATGGPG